MMRSEHAQMFHDLMESPGFVAALQSFVEVEIGYRIDSLRSYCRQGNTQQAGVIEGEIGALQELPALFKKYAKQIE